MDSHEVRVTETAPVESMLAEFFDGYALVGFIAGTQEPVIFIDRRDKKTRIALNAILSTLAKTECGGRHE